ncbi:MAG: pyrroline-5-carboxylate reductase [Verrucomicrobiota bacterium]
MKSLGVLGCGRMGSALVLGAVRSGVVEAGKVFLYDIFPGASASLGESAGGQIAASAGEVVSKAEVVLLCTKPGDLCPMLESLAEDSATDGQLFVSIAAGVTIEAMESALPAGERVVRVMPNTPALVGKGASAFALGTNATRDDAETAMALLGGVGEVIEVKESLLDAVTGLSGSGPAFVYTFIEAMADAGVLCGLAREQSLALAAQTVSGAAEMVLQQGEHPAKLRDMVTSPGGTTIAGLAELEANGFRTAIVKAVRAATERSKELGEG